MFDPKGRDSWEDLHRQDNEKPRKITNVFGDAIVENLADCPGCHGTGEVWEWFTWEDGTGDYAPAYCKCGVKVGTVPEPPLEDDYPDDDREQIEPGDYRYYDVEW